MVISALYYHTEQCFWLLKKATLADSKTASLSLNCGGWVFFPHRQITLTVTFTIEKKAILLLPCFCTVLSSVMVAQNYPLRELEDINP